MRKRKSNEQPLKEVFDDLLKIYRIEDPYRSAEVASVYRDVMGQAVFKQTKDIRLNRGVLYITLNSPVLKTEFSYAKDKLKTLINNKMGKEVIKDVKIY